MIKKLGNALVALLITVLSCTSVFAITIPDSIEGYILDDANVLSEETENYISEMNYQMDQHCGGYVEIVTEEYINCDVADYAYTLFNEWQIGGSKNNNGILLVLVTEEEKYYLMYGRGIEKKVESYEFQEIVDQYFENDFDNGNYDSAVRNTYDQLYTLLGNLYGFPTSNQSSQNSNTQYKRSFLSRIFSYIGGIFSILWFIVFIIIFIIVLSLLFRPRRYGYYRGPRTHYYRPYHHYGGPRPGPGPRMGGGPRSFGGHSSSGSFGGRSGGSFGGRSSGGGSRGGGVGRR